MTAHEVGKKLVELCQEGRNFEAMTTLYADGVVSVEAGAPPGMPREYVGREAVLAKAKWWVDNHEIHSRACDGPFPHDDRFIVTFDYDVTNKPSGQRFRMKEAALYTVADGKVVREEFFYSMG